MKKWMTFLLFPLLSFAKKEDPSEWIRINQLGYLPDGIKVAVWCSKKELPIKTWQLVDVNTGKVVDSGKASKPFGAYGPFQQSCRLDFSSFKKTGVYYLRAGETKSPLFEISHKVYRGSADLCLRYMRQQRSGFNSYLRDSCHTHDGYVLYGEKAGIKDSTYIDVVGGWHDASDYLQYASTSANATYHLLAAYRDFPHIFTDEKLANGLNGKNGMADVLDEAKWGLDWLLKMHPRDDWMFNQVGDDRDHMGMRIPKQDTNYYGKGLERPVYFLNGEPQQRGKFMNNTTGTASTAGKFASAFALGSSIFRREFSRVKHNPDYNKYSETLYFKAYSAFSFGYKKPGNTQTASVRSPYIYAEDNWVDDMELAAVSVYNCEDPHARDYRYINYADSLSKLEKITPWLGADTAKHYQWYPFVNPGHYELAKKLRDKQRDKIIGYYKKGIRLVWNKAKQNAFCRGIPFIWCSNNLTVSFAIQCYWYKHLTGDKTFDELEQANFDWLFGCNPWGTGFVYGLPYWGHSPVDPHSAFTHLKDYPIDGGLLDGPVYTSIYKNLIGIKLYEPDEYAPFQSDLAVYHDDYGDYSTNEPTMDGTASLIYLLAAKENEASPESHPWEWTPEDSPQKNFSYSHGAITRGDSTKKKIALVFTGHEFAEGGDFIARTLKKEKINASFFFTGDFYRNPAFKKIIFNLKDNGNYLGIHGDKHLLYCDWNKRDSLLIDKLHFEKDILQNQAEQLKFLVANKKDFFIPSYEWYNDTIAAWSANAGFQLINYTPGTLSHADYTATKDKNFRSCDTIYNSIINYERAKPSGLNGFLLLMHIGAGPDRADKLYSRLPVLIKYLKAKGYNFQRVDELLGVD